MENKKLIKDIHRLLNEKKKKSAEEKAAEKEENAEKPLKEFAGDASGFQASGGGGKGNSKPPARSAATPGRKEGPLEDVIHMIARAAEIGDKKMMNQAKNNMKGIPAELQSSLKLIMKSLG